MRKKPLCFATALAVLLAAGCSKAAEAETSVTREPVNSTTNPFMEPIGTDQPNVTPPANAGGPVSGETAGLYGGTLDEASCDQAKMVGFLDQHPDRAAAWASVLGITTGEIGAYVADLTPTVLRSDTYVINHGFDNGQVTAAPTVLQAGTAVLVDAYGFPVTKCYCGNPLQRPTSYDRIVYTGPSWNSFSTTNVTIVQSTNVVINQFILVDPAGTKAFDRPRGTDGHKDGPPIALPPPSGPPSLPVQVPPNDPGPGGPPPGGPSSGPSGGQPGGPPSGPSANPPRGPSGAPPSGQRSPAPPPSGQRSPAPPPSGQRSGAPPPSGGVIPAPSASPAPPSGRPSGPSPGASPGPSGASPGARAATANASWAVGNCFADAAQTLHGTVLVRNNDTAGEQTYEVTVTFGSRGDVTTSLPTVAAGKTADANVELPSTDPGLTPNATVPCSITKIVDSSGRTPTQGPALPPPPDNRPATPPATTAPSTGPTTPSREPSVIPAPSGPDESSLPIPAPS